MTSFAIQLSNSLRGAKMTKAELARRVGCSRTTVTEWCFGRYRPSREALARINEVLGTKLSLVHAISATEVARGLGLHVDTLRRAMREEGLFRDIGEAIPSRRGERWSYRFYPEQVRLKLGI